MNFLGAVIAFLSMVYLAWFAFTQIESNLLGLASMGAMGLTFAMIVLSIKEDR